MSSLQALAEQSKFLGEEFITYLWWRGLADGGTSGADDDASFCFVQDAVVLQSERGDAKELRLSKGNPSEDKAAFRALARGMRPVKAKLRIQDADLTWTFTLAAATLACASIALPPATSKDPMGRVQDRIFLLEEGINHLHRRFKQFLLVRGEDPEALASEIRAWVQEHLSGVLAETG